MKPLHKNKIRAIELIAFSIAIPLLMYCSFQVGRFYETAVQLSEPVRENLMVGQQADNHGELAELIFDIATLTPARITAYNTVSEQTDDKPCESASGDWICGRNDVVTCPPRIPFYTWVEICGEKYECLDRTGDQAPNHFDISFDKDLQGAKNWGVRYLVIKWLTN